MIGTFMIGTFMIGLFYDWVGGDIYSVSEVNRIEMKTRNMKGHNRDEKDKQR